MRRVAQILREETAALRPRWSLAATAAACLPVMTLSRLRGLCYRAGGLPAGRGTVFMGRLRITGHGRLAARLRIGRNCILNDRVTFNLGETVTLGDGVAVGMECLFITESHAVGDALFRAGRRTRAPIQVGTGAWLAARVTLLPGAAVGAGAVIAAGAVVRGNIPPNVLAAGVPARPVRDLPAGNPAPDKML